MIFIVLISHVARFDDFALSFRCVSVKLLFVLASNSVVFSKFSKYIDFGIENVSFCYAKVFF